MTKNETRKTVADERKEVFLTGGGVKNIPKQDPNDTLLLSIMNNKTVFGLENKFNSEGLEQVIISNPMEEGEILYELEDSDDNLGDAQPQPTTSWDFNMTPEAVPLAAKNSGTTPAAKRTPLSSNRCRPTATVRALSLSHFAAKYEELLDKRLVVAQHELQKLKNDLEYQKTEHNLRAESLKLKITIQKKQFNSMK